MSDSLGTGGWLRSRRRVWSVMATELGRIVEWSLRRSWWDRAFWLLLLTVAALQVASYVTHSALMVILSTVALVVFILYTAGFLTWQIRSNKRAARSRVQDAVLARIRRDEERRLTDREVDGQLPPFALPQGEDG